MGVSSVVVFALLDFLTLLVSDAVCSDAWCFDESDILTVHLVQKESERISEITPPDYEIRTVPQVQQANAGLRSASPARNGKDAERDEDPVPPSDLTPARDWHVIAKEAARQSVDDRFRQEEIRLSMWRNTGSVMFRDNGGFDFHEPATVIADREFRVPVGVLGIGMTIGGCFIGIPLAGIPVERRTAGPNVIYCTDIYE